MGALRTYRNLLTNRPLARLLAGEFVSSIGDWLYLVALVVLVYRETKDPVLLGVVGAVRMVPYILLSIPAGVITDRYDRRYVLLASDLARAACMVVLAALVSFHASLIAITAVAMLAACCSTFFYPAIGALIPSLVSDESEFGPANSAWATLDNAAWILGPAIAGALIAAGNIVMAFVLNAVSFLVIAAILWTLPPAKPEAVVEAEVRSRRYVAETTAIARTRGIIATLVGAGVRLGPVVGVMLLHSVLWFAFGGISILIVVLAVDVFHGGDPVTGYLNGAIGLGGTIGAVISGALVLRPRLRRFLLLGAVTFGCAAVALGLASQVVFAFAAILVLSAGNLITDVTGTTIFQRAVPDAYRGRFSGINLTVQTASEAAGTLVVPFAVSHLGFGRAFADLGLLTTIVAVGAVLLVGPAADLAATPYDDDLRRLARLPLFGGLSPAAMERVLRRLQPIEAAQGDVIVWEGEEANRFYVICHGTFAVTKSETGSAPIRLRTLGRDDVFGERGLLARAPRAATVAAETRGRLLAMDGTDFLELIGGQQALRDRLLALYDSPPDSIARG